MEQVVEQKNIQIELTPAEVRLINFLLKNRAQTEDFKEDTQLSKKLIDVSLTMAAAV